MKSLTGYLKKIQSLFKQGLLFLLAVSSILSTSLLTPQKADAASNIAISNTIIYTLDDNGNLSAKLDYTLHNQGKSTEVIKYFTANLPYVNITSYSVSDNSKVLESTKHFQKNSTDIVIDFKHYPLKPNQNYLITINVSVKEFYATSGSTKQIAFPTQIKGSDVTNVLIKIPIEIGKINVENKANINQGKDQNYNTVRITDPAQQSLHLLIGEVISHSFLIKKSLINSTDTTQTFLITLPRGDNNHSVYYRIVSPAPKYAYRDEDHNDFAVYELEPGEEKEVQIGGDIVFIEKNDDDALSIEDKLALTRLNNYWQISDAAQRDKIIDYLSNAAGTKISLSSGVEGLNESKRQVVYKAAYSYVIEQLTPLTTKASNDTSNLRTGISLLISSNNPASAEDYADYLISIYRELGIPARMITGYISNINQTYEEGFFHTWVEYWNQERGWTAVDPALQDILNHELFGEALYDHIPIIAKGHNPTSPKLSQFNYNELNFLLNNNSISSNSNSDVQISFSDVYVYLPLTNVSLKVENKGNTVIKAVNYSLENRVGQLLENNHIILPGTTEHFQIKYPLPISSLTKDNLTRSLTSTVEVLDSNNVSKQFVVSNDFKIIKYWWWNWLIKLATLVLLLIAITILYNLTKLIINKAKRWN
ncbi:MAG: hypothetical protein Fur003_5140 [Candidatus Dojkabacteria bacterium]